MGATTGRVTRVTAGLLALGLVLGLNSGCERQATQTAAESAEPITVYTTFHPTTYFAERIAPENVTVVNPVPAEADPATWDPADEVLAEYQAADLIVINGADFEEWVGYASLPEGRIVDTTAPIKDDLIRSEHGVTHAHGPEGEHVHEGEYDGHVWLNPLLAIQQATVIRDALLQRLPDQRETIEENFAALIADLNALDERLRTLKPRVTATTLVANHPAYDYLAGQYGWNVTSFHFEPDAMPDDEALAELRAFQQENNATLILWESEPAAPIAEAMENLFGLKSVVYAPGERVASGEDYLSVMQANLDRLEAALPATPDA